MFSLPPDNYLSKNTYISAFLSPHVSVLFLFFESYVIKTHFKLSWDKDFSYGLTALSSPPSFRCHVLCNPLKDPNLW